MSRLWPDPPGLLLLLPCRGRIRPAAASSSLATAGASSYLRARGSPQTAARVRGCGRLSSPAKVAARRRQAANFRSCVAQRFNYYTRRRKNRETKRSMLRNMSEYAEHLFQCWRDEDEKSDASSGPSWFRGHRWVRNSNNSGFRTHDFHYGNFRSRGGIEFCTSDEDEPEILFRNAFRQQHTYYWSFSSDSFRWRNSRRAHSEKYRNWSSETDDEDEVSEVSLARQALGLSASGPLKLEDVKSAYRACALRWHPDRHNGSSKATAEEKFKHCSAAYKTLCDSLATA